MLHLFIDSSIFSRDIHRTSPKFAIFKRLASYGLLVTHIPYVVMMEYFTQRVGLLEEIFESTQRRMRKFHRNFENLQKASLINIADLVSLDRFEEEIERYDSARNRVAKFVKDEFNLWCLEVNAIVHEIAPDHGVRVMNDYFSGNPPFDRPKNRADIPDSFIWHCILDVLSKEKVVHVISNDNALLNACKIRSGIHIYKSIQEFSESEAYRKTLILDNFDNYIEENSDKFEECFEEKESELRSYINDTYYDWLIGKNVYIMSIDCVSDVVTVASLDKPEDLYFFFENAEYFGDGMFSFQFQFSVDTDLTPERRVSQNYVLAGITTVGGHE